MKNSIAVIFLCSITVFARAQDVTITPSEIVASYPMVQPYDNFPTAYFNLINNTDSSVFIEWELLGNTMNDLNWLALSCCSMISADHQFSAFPVMVMPNDTAPWVLDVIPESGAQLGTGELKIRFFEENDTVTLGTIVYRVTSDSYVSLVENSIERNEASIFPNPSNGSFKLDLSEINNAEIKVYSITGKLLFESFEPGESTIDLDLALEPGTYILKINSPGKQTSQKIIIQ